MPEATVEQYPAWDRLMIKPQVPLKPVGSSGELTLLLYHSYPGPLHHLRIEAVGGEVLPAGPAAELALVPPTEIHTVTLKLRHPGVARTDTAPLRLRFATDEVATRREIDVTVPLTVMGASKVNQSLTMPVGSVPVTVIPRSRYAFAVDCVVLAALLAWWWARKRRVQRQGR